MSRPRCRTSGQCMITATRHAPTISKPISRAVTSEPLRIRGMLGVKRANLPVEMRVLGRIAVPLWLGAIGVIVMYVFFVAIASISPSQVAGVTLVIAGLTVLFAIRSFRVASELANRGGNPALRRARNRARERRGF